MGKTQERFLIEGISEYEKRVRKYCNFKFDVVKAANYNSLSQSQCLEKEGDKLLAMISQKNKTISCDENGRFLTSQEFANQFVTWSNEGFSRFDFLIGGAYGISQSVKTTSDMQLSFSPMTFTHQMFRLVLIEQIYRAFTIIKGEKYHHF